MWACIQRRIFTFLLPSMLVLLWLLCHLPCSYGWIADIAQCRLSSRQRPDPFSHGSAVVAFSAVSNAAENRAIPAAGIPRELENLGLLESLDCDEDEESLHQLGSEAAGKDRKRRVERVSMNPSTFEPSHCRWKPRRTNRLPVHLPNQNSSHEHSMVGWKMTSLPWRRLPGEPTECFRTECPFTRPGGSNPSKSSIATARAGNT